MRLGIRDWRAGRGGGHTLSPAFLVVLVLLALSPTAVRAHDAAPPPVSDMMNSAGSLERITMQLEAEAVSDVRMLPETGAALAREWRSFDRNGSGLGALIALGWTLVAAGIALCAEKAFAWGLGRRLRQALRARSAGPDLGELLLLLVYDALALAVFVGVFVQSRHWLMGLDVTATLFIFVSNILIRWRIAALVIGVVLRPRVPVARLIDVPDGEARRLARFMSGTILAVVTLIGIARMGLADEDSGASHVIGLLVGVVVCGLYTLIVVRSRAAAEALIRGRRGDGIIAALRDGLARSWLAVGLTAVAGLLVLFVFGLSLGLLSYFRAINATLGVLFLLVVLGQLAERGWHQMPEAGGSANGAERLTVRALRRFLRAVVLLAAVLTLADVWIEGIQLSPTEAARATQSAWSAGITLFVAYSVWELGRLAIERHLQTVSTGPKLPGDEDEETAPGSRLQTILPMLRAALGILIAVIVTLIVLSRLGIDTAPLIAGAGVFGLAISFGAQSLVRDIISGLFYLWDDAFRVGEYIDTGRLKGTVEALGIRSVKVRHHNGPLHTIPYGQLGAVTNQSRDFATIKFNLRLERGTDVELVRKTAKQIGIAMQDEPEIATEVILPLKMQGIVDVADTAVVFRFKFTARPVKPSWVQREYVKRMYRVFAEKGIEFARGALTLQQLPAEFGAESEMARPALAEALVSAPTPARVA